MEVLSNAVEKKNYQMELRFSVQVKTIIVERTAYALRIDLGLKNAWPKKCGFFNKWLMSKQQQKQSNSFKLVNFLFGKLGAKRKD